jgi:V/A-type H+-transporting ATPase subunit D
MAGPEAVCAAALAARSEFPLEVSARSVMGIRVPEIEQKRVARPLSGRGFSYVATSTTIDEAAEAFETKVGIIMRLAESELRLRRLAEEIQRTSRRLNALDHVLLPRLEAERSMIQAALDERERADRFRLKLMKRILERKRESEEMP